MGLLSMVCVSVYVATIRTRSRRCRLSASLSGHMCTHCCCYFYGFVVSAVANIVSGFRHYNVIAVEWPTCTATCASLVSANFKVVELIPTARGSLARLHLLLGTTVGYARLESTYNPTILHDSEHVNRAAFDRYMQTRCRQRAWPSVSETYKARVSHKPEPKMCVYI